MSPWYVPSCDATLNSKIMTWQRATSTDHGSYGAETRLRNLKSEIDQEIVEINSLLDEMSAAHNIRRSAARKFALPGLWHYHNCECCLTRRSLSKPQLPCDASFDDYLASQDFEEMKPRQHGDLGCGEQLYSNMAGQEPGSMEYWSPPATFTHEGHDEMKHYEDDICDRSLRDNDQDHLGDEDYPLNQDYDFEWNLEALDTFESEMLDAQSDANQMHLNTPPAIKLPKRGHRNVAALASPEVSFSSGSASRGVSDGSGKLRRVSSSVSDKYLT